MINFREPLFPLVLYQAGQNAYDIQPYLVHASFSATGSSWHPVAAETG